MKDKPIAIYITLLGGLIACICSILNNVGLFYTLLFTFIALFAFMIIGLIVNRWVSSVNKEVEEAEKAEQKRLEEERLEQERLEEEAREKERLEAEAQQAEENAEEQVVKKPERQRLF